MIPDQTAPLADLCPYCLQYRLRMCINTGESRQEKVVTGGGICKSLFKKQKTKKLAKLTSMQRVNGILSRLNSLYCSHMLKGKVVSDCDSYNCATLHSRSKA